jgi:hypothetical protein
MNSRRDELGIFRVVTALVLLAGMMLLMIPPTISAEKAETQVSGEKPTMTKEQALETAGNLPVYFEENQGQFNRRVRYFARGTRGYDLFLTATDAVYVLRDGATERRSDRAIDDLTNQKSKIKNP